MPIKNGDKVYFKIKSGAIKTGIYDSKTKMVMMSGGKKAMPPKKAMFHTRASAMKAPFVDLRDKAPELGSMPSTPKPKKSKNAKEKATPTKTPTEELSDEAKEKKEDFLKYGQGVGKRVSFRGKVNKSNPEKTRITVGVIEGFTNKGIVVRAEKGKVSKEGADRKIGTVNYSRSQIVWTPTSGTTKKVVSWSMAKRGPDSGGKGGKIILDTIGG